MKTLIQATFSREEANALHDWEPGKQVSHNGECHRIVYSDWCTDGTVCYTLERVADTAAPVCVWGVTFLKFCGR